MCDVWTCSAVTIKFVHNLSHLFTDTGMPKDRSMARRNVLRGQSSLSEGDREEGEEGGERDHSIQLLARSNTVSAFLREPLLEEAS